MKILVFGKSGQVAQALQKYEGVIALDRTQANLMRPAECAAIIKQSNADAIINAAAYTAVDMAESEPDTAVMVNTQAPAVMARAAAVKGLPFVQISTDYVFDGMGDTPWIPNEPTAPQNVYGSSKLAGEQAIIDAGGCYVILRTSWVFSATGANFVKTMLRLSETRENLTIVDDQIGGPTAADDIAAACIKIAKQLVQNPAKAGVYHFAGKPNVSWAGFAREIFAKAGRDVQVEGIPTSAYPTLAKRPLNSRLECSGLSAFNIARPEWHPALTRVLNALENTS